MSNEPKRRPIVGADTIADYAFPDESDRKKARARVYYLHAQRLIPTFLIGKQLAMIPDDYDEMIERRSAAAVAEVG